jgi:hypothetical protein
MAVQLLRHAPRRAKRDVDETDELADRPKAGGARKRRLAARMKAQAEKLAQDMDAALEEETSATPGA